MTIRPIDTIYNGHLFRSRLEARWAVFFDELDLSWEYEDRGFDIDEVWYLPDFKIKRSDSSVLWVEVKPADTEEDRKFSLFSSTVSRPDDALLVNGAPFHYVDYWGEGYLQTFLRVPVAVHGLLRGNTRAADAKAKGLIRKAAQVALRARFEHGARGR